MIKLLILDILLMKEEFDELKEEAIIALSKMFLNSDIKEIKKAIKVKWLEDGIPIFYI